VLGWDYPPRNDVIVNKMNVSLMMEVQASRIDPPELF